MRNPSISLFSFFFITVCTGNAFPEPTHAPESVLLTWDVLPAAEYCIHIHLKHHEGIRINGRYTEYIENAISSDILGSARQWTFNGTCPGRPDVPSVVLGAIDSFEVNAAFDGTWGDLSARNAARRVWDGMSSTLHLSFPFVVAWNIVPDASEYRLSLHLRDDQVLGIAESIPADQLYHVFRCDTFAGVDSIKPTDIVEVRVQALDPDGTIISHAKSAFTLRTRTFLDFPDSPVTGLQRKLLFRYLADPGVYADVDRYILSGTNERDTSRLPLYVTANRDVAPDRAEWRLETWYTPNDPESNAYDPDYVYYHIWGPEIRRFGDEYRLYFSSIRRPRTPDASPWMHVDDTVTIFEAVGKKDLDFGPPIPYDTGISGAPRHTLDYDPPETSGCPMRMKLDCALWPHDEPERVFYSWFHHGNHVASFRLQSENPDIIVHASPVHPEDEGISEAPEPYMRNGKLYLFFSTGWFNSQYRIRYLVADTVHNLRRETAMEFDLTQPVMYEDRILENAGHCSVLEHDGETYLFYHTGTFRDGIYPGARDTFVAPLRFRDDDSIYPLSY